MQRQSVVAANLMCLLAFLNFDNIFPRLFTVDTGLWEIVDQNSRSDGSSCGTYWSTD